MNFQVSIWAFEGAPRQWTWATEAIGVGVDTGSVIMYKTQGTHNNCHGALRALKTCSCGALCKVPIQHFFFLEVPLIRGNLLCPTTHVYSVLHVCTWTVLVHTVSQNYEYSTLGSIQWITWTKNRWVSCVISTLNLYKKMSRIYSGMLHWLFSQLEFRWVLLRALSVGALQ